MTSTFTHLSPALFTYTLRWGSGYGPGYMRNTWKNTFRICSLYNDLTISGKEEEERMEELYDDLDDCMDSLFCYKGCEANAKDMIAIPSIIYILWAIPYFLFLFIIFRQYISRNDKETLYSFLINDRGMKWFLLKFAPAEPYLMRPLLYITSHFMLVIVLGSLSILLWDSFYLHTLLLFFFSFVVIKNSANWIFHYFALRYAEVLLQQHELTKSKEVGGGVSLDDPPTIQLVPGSQLPVNK